MCKLGINGGLNLQDGVDASGRKAKVCSHLDTLCQKKKLLRVYLIRRNFLKKLCLIRQIFSLENSIFMMNSFIL